jgi:hypothetical protein
MRCTQRAVAGIVAIAFASAAWATSGDGLKANADDLPWARWQGRVSFGFTAPAWRTSFGGSDPAGLRVNGVSLAGDYYFTDSLIGRGISGGFRTTGGLILGPRSQATTGQPTLGALGTGFSVERRLLGPATTAPYVDPTADTAPVPYLGLGYTGLSLRGGWSFSADLGLVALSPGSAVRLGRVFSGTQTLDDMVREMRLAPVLQMGVSYAF